MIEETPQTPQEELHNAITHAFDWSGIKSVGKVGPDSVQKVWIMLDEITSLRRKIPEPTVVEKGRKYAWREKGEKGPWQIGKCTHIVNEGVAMFETGVHSTVRSTAELEIIPAL